MEDLLLDVKHLKKYFGTPSGLLHAVDDVSFSVKRGTTLGVVGESGCGKSTLGSTLLYLDEPTGGEILFEGTNLQSVGKKEFKPAFVVCDEPVSALDVSIQAQILNLLMDLQDSMNLTYLFITHDLSVVKHISDEIMVMYRGKCVEQASSAELFRKPLHPYTRALLAAIPDPSPESRNKKRSLLQGEVASPVNPGPGCRFAARCPFVKEECRTGEIMLEEVSPGHFAACPGCVDRMEE